jgi:hypothetical protein
VDNPLPVSAGHSYAEVAKQLMVSERDGEARSPASSTSGASTRLSASIHMQVGRLAPALRTADERVEGGDMKAAGPLLKLIGALDRYHGLEPRYRREPRLAAFLAAPAAPLALAAQGQDFVQLSESNTQPLLKA